MLGRVGSVVGRVWGLVVDSVVGLAGCVAGGSTVVDDDGRSSQEPKVRARDRFKQLRSPRLGQVVSVRDERNENGFALLLLNVDH